MVPFLAVAATVLELSISLLLIAGYRTRWAACAAGALTLVFAIAMAYSFGIKEPLDYGVFVDAAASLLLAAAPSYTLSLDEYLNAKRDHG